MCVNLRDKSSGHYTQEDRPRASERASELPSARELSVAAATAAEATAAAAIVQTKQDSFGDEASSTTAHETDEPTNE